MMFIMLGIELFLLPILFRLALKLRLGIPICSEFVLIFTTNSATLIAKGGTSMPSIRPISDLRNNANEISDFCRQTREPVYITRNGTGDMVVVSIEEYERQQALIDLYGKLAVAEQEIASGAEGEDFLTAARQMRERVHGKI